MPTATASANTAAQTMFVTPVIKKGKIKSVNIDNQDTSDHTIRLIDTFTPDASNGTPSPSVQTLYPRQWTVGKGLTADISEKELKGLDILGTCQVVADAIAALCVIKVSYDLE